MASLKEVRIRIASVKSTQQITSAMKMVSASKLKRAQNAIIKMRPYAAKLKEILENLSASLDTSESVFSKERKIQKVLLVAITSNRGLCGAFNTNVIKLTLNTLQTKYAEQYKNGNVDLICIGKKAIDFFVKKKYSVIDKNTKILDAASFENAAPIAEQLMKWFETGKYDRIEIIYNQFKNAGVQILVNEQYLPVAPPKTNVSVTKKQQTDYIFEPGKKEIVSELIPKSLKIQFYKAILDSVASEHGARMTAMHKATDNADGLLKELRLSYNKARQAAITSEILEIVSGAEALKG
ncbi:MAG TPA: ATP synthase F1 subunit gamma [Bacteroidales bacterium]|nr:ATP synthase F1 subunit gamma [Bacteroidales bacterium]HPS16672.1 ATP synthase F1 subunit gamma [Bacteroidales bacterium]